MIRPWIGSAESHSTDIIFQKNLCRKIQVRFDTLRLSNLQLEMYGLPAIVDQNPNCVSFNVTKQKFAFVY